MKARDLERDHRNALFENLLEDEARAVASQPVWVRAACLSLTKAPSKRMKRAVARARKVVPNHVFNAIIDHVDRLARRERPRAKNWMTARRVYHPDLPNLYAEKADAACHRKQKGMYGGYPYYEYFPVYAIARRGREVRYWVARKEYRITLIGARERAKVDGVWVAARLVSPSAGLGKAWRKRLAALEPVVQYRGSVVWSRDGFDYHLTPQTTPGEVHLAWTKRRAEARHKARDLAALEQARVNPVWVEFSDSTRSGNCRFGTAAFCRALGFPADIPEADIGAPSDWLLAVQDDQYTRRAVVAAARRQA